MINLIEANVEWHEGYGNMPTIDVMFDAQHLVSISSRFVYEDVYDSGDKSAFLLASREGLASYGIYSNENLGRFAPQTWRGSMPYVLRVKSGDSVKQVEYPGYSSSRASVFSVAVGSANSFDPLMENNIYDVSVFGIENETRVLYSMAVTHSFVKEKLAPYLKERLTYVLACKRNTSDKMDVEGYALILMPSLSPTELVFPTSCKEKQDSLSQRYAVEFCF